MSEIIKYSMGNVIAPKSASILFGTEADDAKTGLKTEDSTDTWNDYTIIADNTNDMTSEELLDYLGSKKVETLTLAEYEALTTKNSDVIYCITDDNYEGSDSVESGRIDSSEVSALISAHNSNASAHQDIRNAIPTTLPNPQSLTFTGAATGTYNGSSALTINIPTSSGSSSNISSDDIDSAIEGHNASSTAHNDIRQTIDGLNYESVGAAAASHNHTVSQISNINIISSSSSSADITPGTTQLSTGSIVIVYEV